jgi:hypothetical protein
MPYRLAILWLTVGWWLRAGARPRTSVAALGTAAAAGLLASWMCNLFLAPMFSTELGRIRLYPLRAEESPTWRFDPDGSRFRITQPDIDIPHLDLNYLERFVPPEKRDSSRLENASAYSDAHRDLMAANRYYRATAGDWLTQFTTLLCFLSAALVSAWAADYLVRSGRGPVACIFCYAELYLSAMALLTGLALVVIFAIIMSDRYLQGGPPVAPFAAILTGAVVLTALAYVGVLRRWHPAIPIAGYVIGGVALWLYLSYGAG